MREEINNCVCCPPEMGCVGDSCPLRHCLRIFCDNCGKEIYSDDECWQDEEENDYCWKCARELGVIADN